MSTTPSLDDLNRQFAIPGCLSFRDAGGGLVVADVVNTRGRAAISLQGGHVMTWQPAGQAEPVIWLSDLAKLAPGKSIRGGVPVCWPWFGPHATEAKWPGHGFARTVPWVVTASATEPGGATRLSLTLVENEQTRTQWPHPSTCSIDIVVGDSLKVSLHTDNRGGGAFEIGEALHTYFRIGDIAEARVLGLEGAEYVDKVSGSARLRQSGAITFSGETDRVYVSTAARCVIEDRALKRRIVIDKTGSQSTVVWTPWTEKADKMGDFGPNGWRKMVCVESGNALENRVTVAAGARHTLAVEYRAEAL